MIHNISKWSLCSDLTLNSSAIQKKKSHHRWWPTPCQKLLRVTWGIAKLEEFLWPPLTRNTLNVIGITNLIEWSEGILSSKILPSVSKTFSFSFSKNLKMITIKKINVLSFGHQFRQTKITATFHLSNLPKNFSTTTTTTTNNTTASQSTTASTPNPSENQQKKKTILVPTTQPVTQLKKPRYGPQRMGNNLLELCFALPNLGVGTRVTR